MDLTGLTGLTGLTYGYAPVPGVKKNASLAIIRSNNELIIKAVYIYRIDYVLHHFYIQSCAY